MSPRDEHGLRVAPARVVKPRVTKRYGRWQVLLPSGRGNSNVWRPCESWEHAQQVAAEYVWFRRAWTEATA